MKYYGIKRVAGRGYENRYVVVRRGRRRDLAFFFFLTVFAGTVYLLASAFFRAISYPLEWVSAVRFAF